MGSHGLVELEGDVPWPAGVAGRPAVSEISDQVVRQALERAAWDKRRAREEYRAAIELAHSKGWGHTEIARVVGVSEGAIRLYLKRSQKRTRRKG